jgi:GAF domain-containing protein/HAMP domain-containing protein
MPAQNQTNLLKPKIEEQSPRLRNSQRLLIVMAILAGIFTLVSLTGGVILHLWPFFLISALFAISCISCIFTLTNFWDAPYAVKLLLTTLAFEISFALAGGVVSFAYGLPIGFIAFVVAFLFAAFNPTGWLNEWFIGLGLIGFLGSALLCVLAPFSQFSSVSLNIALGVLAFLSVIILIQLIRRGLIITTLRLKLILIAVVLSVVPLIILSFINTQSVSNTISTQTNDSLKVATQLTVSQMDSFINSNLNSLKNEASLPVFSSYLGLPKNGRAHSNLETELIQTINTLQNTGAVYTPSFGVLDLVGLVLYDTDKTKIGDIEINTDYFQTALGTESAYVSHVKYSKETGKSYIYFITPILDKKKTVIGFLRMMYDSNILQDELEKTSGLAGSTSYPILLDANGIRLADASNPDLVYHTIEKLDPKKYTALVNDNWIPSTLSETQIVSPIEDLYNQLFVKKIKPYQFFDVRTTGNVQNSATYGVTTTQKWYVVYLQEKTALLKTQQNLTQSTAIIGVLLASLVALFITIISNLATQPIYDLIDTAQLIADGNLDAHVNVTSKDEFGTMGKAFNSMAQQLKSSFENMEKRVHERTIELGKQNETLRYRSRQLQTVTDVARIIVSKNEMEPLLTLVTELISDRFNFYHAGIFLLDETGENAVLRASNSAGGLRMLNRQHKLKVGQVGIVGYVTGTGNPRIATDVGKDAVFFNNPDLPETKSEMALPLKIEDRIIGALDIQSIESNAFTQDDISLFTTLADQISVAINNNQLLSNTQKALEETQNLHRQYLNQEWTKRAADAGNTSYKFSAQGLTTYEEDLPEVKMVYQSGRPVTRSVDQKSNNEKSLSILAVPILLRGEVIGVIHLTESKDSSFAWSESELVTVQTLADQLAQTLESARLFEQTIRRADRERRVLEITSKIRSTNDPQQMLEITLEELKRHLGASQAQIVFNLPGQELTSEKVDSTHLKGSKEVQA